MSKLLASALVLGLVGTPVQAHGWQNQPAEVRTGAFVGARLQLSLGGNRAAKPRAALAIAPTQSRISSDGVVRTRIGEGFALNLSPRAKPSLTLAGIPAGQVLGLQRQRQAEADNRLGISTGGWIAIGVGTAAVAGALIFYSIATDCDDHDDECG